MKRILCSLLVAALPFGSALADEPKSKDAKVTLVYPAILKVRNFWDSRISKSLIQGWDAALALPR
jgi:hypothetical protein